MCAFTVLFTLFKQRTDFIRHEVTRRQGRQAPEYKPSPEKIDLGTTYNQNFNPYEITQPTFAVRPKDMTRSTDTPKMVTIPSYKGVSFLSVSLNARKIEREIAFFTTKLERYHYKQYSIYRFAFVLSILDLYCVICILKSS